MRKKLIACALTAVLITLLSGCSTSTYQSITFTAKVVLTGSFDFTVTGKTNENANAAGTINYKVTKSKTDTASGSIDILNMTSTVIQTDRTLISSVNMYPQTLYPLNCEKSLSVKDTPSQNWTSKGVYSDKQIVITLDSSNPDYEPKSDDLKIPINGDCYDNETLILLARTADIALGSGLPIQAMNIQTGLSDSLVISVAAETENVKYKDKDYVCRRVDISSTGLFSKAAIQLWITDDVNRVPLKIVQSNMTYILTNYTLG